MSFVNISNASTNSKVNSVSVSVPAGSVGDLMLMVAVNCAVVAYSSVSGWTPVETLSATKNNVVAAGLWYRYATGTESSSYSPAWSGTTNACVAGIIRYSGVPATTSPTDTNRHGWAQLGTTSSSASPTSAVPPTLSAATSSDLILNVYCYGQAIRTGGKNDSNQTTGLPSWNSAPSGWAQRGTTMTAATGATSWNCGYLICDKPGATDLPTASTSCSPTDDGSTWVVYSLALAQPSLNQFMPFFGM